MATTWTWIKVALAQFGAFLGLWLGGLDSLLLTLIGFVVLDYISGVLRAIVEKRLSSRLGAKGIAKKIGIFLVIAAGHWIDQHLGLGSALRTAAIVFYLANEGISMVENLSAIGLPIPTKIKDALEQLHCKD
jgi:toxin secretion/phage lysis holin